MNVLVVLDSYLAKVLSHKVGVSSDSLLKSRLLALQVLNQTAVSCYGVVEWEFSRLPCIKRSDFSDGTSRTAVGPFDPQPPLAVASERFLVLFVRVVLPIDDITDVFPFLLSSLVRLGPVVVPLDDAEVAADLDNACLVVANGKILDGLNGGNLDLFRNFRTLTRYVFVEKSQGFSMIFVKNSGSYVWAQKN